ncbi:MAG TPA: hypothetical protein PKE13_07090 [Hyphomicrobium zavarzinii]|nr:hypothetical protein [Hyphomicrobium zavarzinii]
MSGSAMAGSADMFVAMSAMTDDMPCCPDKAPAFPDCQKSCPLMATCMAKCTSGTPMHFGIAFVSREGNALRPGKNAVGEALTIKPPARPPRT